MPTFTYTNDIPFPDHNPSTDQPDMLINTNSIDSIIAVDHYTFEEANLDGYHRIIRQPTGAGTQNVTRSGVGAVYANLPANIVNNNQIFSGVYTPDTTVAVANTQLFTETGSGIISQLTGFLAGSEGWQWIGGILIQWGRVTTNATNGQVIFKDRVAGAIPFPNNCFNVSLTFTAAATLVDQATISVRSNFDKTQFQWRAFGNNTGPTQIDGFTWIAIGN